MFLKVLAVLDWFLIHFSEENQLAGRSLVLTLLISLVSQVTIYFSEHVVLTSIPSIAVLVLLRLGILPQRWLLLFYSLLVPMLIFLGHMKALLEQPEASAIDLLLQIPFGMISWGAILAINSGGVLFIHAFNIAYPSYVYFALSSRSGDEWTGYRSKLLEVFFAIGCGYLIQASNTKTLNDMKRLRDEALAANEARLTFIAKMSHDLRTPLVGLFGFCDMLAESSLSPKQADHLKVIYFSANLLNHLIENLLDFSRLEKGALVLVNRAFKVHSTFRSLGAFFTEFARQKRVRFEMSIDPSVPHAINADKTRLTQVAINLTNNALKFTGSGRRVSVRVHTSASCCSNVLRDVGEANAGQLLVISVHDEGIGIAEEHINKLFHPFYQVTKNSVEGSGLGLYICREIAHLMRGHVCCRSQLGEGSTFTFVCPYERAELSDASTSSAAPSAQVVVSSGKVLVAEDNKVNQMVIANMLRKLGCAFDMVDDGAAACDSFEREEYFLVLMDLMMPVMDGFEATKRITESSKFALRRPTIAALTASVTEHEVKRARECGCVEVLSKPINLAKLQRAVNDAAQRYSQARANRFALGSQRLVPIEHAVGHANPDATTQ